MRPSSTSRPRSWTTTSGSRRCATRCDGSGASNRPRCSSSCRCSTRRTSRGASSTTRAGSSTHASNSRCSASMTRPTRRRARWSTRASRFGARKASRSRPFGGPTGRVTRRARCTRCTTTLQPSSSPSSTPTFCRCPTFSTGRSLSSRTRTWASCRGGGRMRTQTSRSSAATRRSASMRTSSASSTRGSRPAISSISTAPAACGARRASTLRAGGTRARSWRTWTSRCAPSSRAGSLCGATTSSAPTRSHRTTKLTASSSGGGVVGRCSCGRRRASPWPSRPCLHCTRATSTSSSSACACSPPTSSPSLSIRSSCPSSCSSTRRRIWRWRSTTASCRGGRSSGCPSSSP
mmetsp:Transcript_13900/g.36502  ORF Transcript_13900/g.36502 Transcript_13900/m.36502 type:complete len:349 (-) Transcript_13900:323-1369(-)